ncbi:GDYXXLXY domain-containing protein [Halomonas sp. MCCC 1A17488]|uniref:GDYXXLXY domain-containing protein n=1 Tax=unclassified Halomonas TaxID=2609666 RepID=UPI0018D26E6C|nr:MULTISPECIES: GDYXXLXY domain-containing protein [unclassified Halomonas]MCE8016610.1 GDYXXLXY domain-containing protein [Halomonas sp. MCCC 1A17488]MCG3239943.1 GDYXXLXY domain-containing protein [Halomonas sp. MCCC 1A17488]QPP50165.1 GDYXXLXY domain-containing protein [Halomonas sp. SS10-MC5]
MIATAKRDRVVVAAALVLILALVNWSIWAKERHLAEGEVVYLELAPVDPRSLIQGDYMALSFEIGNQIQDALYERLWQSGALHAADGHVVVRLDAQRVAHFQRLGGEEKALGTDELRLRYRVRNGRVRFATDAFFFQEGHAERYEPARYGQFRVNERGEPLLVSMHDAELELLGKMER